MTTLSSLSIVIHIQETDAHQTGAKLKHGEGRQYYADMRVRIVDIIAALTEQSCTRYWFVFYYLVRAHKKKSTESTTKMDQQYLRLASSVDFIMLIV